MAAMTAKAPFAPGAAWPLSAGSDAMRLLATANRRSGWKIKAQQEETKETKKAEAQGEEGVRSADVA
ncbi:hypothetical protein THARTR1_00200 [Trichoderma harzianum]|uniref:Uncharacterized protein n=1 Tax=Trichoderma harzianum TaxID=5544 RepID=A0A2K0UQW7_TRIHA|nr:hypothetical protein THARTR1_00200 [Trichoderma harzianum]